MLQKKLHQFLLLFVLFMLCIVPISINYFQNHYNGDTTENIKNIICIMENDIKKEEIRIINTIKIEDYKIVGFITTKKLGIVTFQKQNQHYKLYTIQCRYPHKKKVLFSFCYFDKNNEEHDYHILLHYNENLAYFYRSKNKENPQKFVVEKSPSMILIDNGELKDGDTIRYQFYDTMEKEI